MIIKDSNFVDEEEERQSNLDDDYDEYEDLGQSRAQAMSRIIKKRKDLSETEKVLDMCHKIMTRDYFSPMNCLISNIDKVIKKVQAQISQNSKRSAYDRR